MRAFVSPNNFIASARTRPTTTLSSISMSMMRSPSHNMPVFNMSERGASTASAGGLPLVRSGHRGLRGILLLVIRATGRKLASHSRARSDATAPISGGGMAFAVSLPAASPELHVLGVRPARYGRGQARSRPAGPVRWRAGAAGW
jgi:hypothetical protein